MRFTGITTQKDLIPCKSLISLQSISSISGIGISAKKKKKNNVVGKILYNGGSENDDIFTKNDDDFSDLPKITTILRDLLLRTKHGSQNLGLLPSTS